MSSTSRRVYPPDRLERCTTEDDGVFEETVVFRAPSPTELRGPEPGDDDITVRLMVDPRSQLIRSR